jgi:hypothetical protein
LDNLERLVIELKESLEREFKQGLTALRTEMRDGFAAINARFDTRVARLDRHAAYWQTGCRWSGKMEDWAERVDTALEARDREIADLRAGISRLEQSVLTAARSCLAQTGRPS